MSIAQTTKHKKNSPSTATAIATHPPDGPPAATTPLTGTDTTPEKVWLWLNTTGGSLAMSSGGAPNDVPEVPPSGVDTTKRPLATTLGCSGGAHGPVVNASAAGGSPDELKVGTVLDLRGGR